MSPQPSMVTTPLRILAYLVTEARQRAGAVCVVYSMNHPAPPLGPGRQTTGGGREGRPGVGGKAPPLRPPGRVLARPRVKSCAETSSLQKAAGAASCLPSSASVCCQRLGHQCRFRECLGAPALGGVGSGHSHRHPTRAGTRTSAGVGIMPVRPPATSPVLPDRACATAAAAAAAAAAASLPLSSSEGGLFGSGAAKPRCCCVCAQPRPL